MIILFIQQQMKNTQFERNKPHFFYQKGWIATNFKVKNNISSILKTKQKNMTETNRPQSCNGSTPIHFRSMQIKRSTKPSTAPQKLQRKHVVSTQNISQIANDQQLLQAFESKYANFKTTINNRKPLLFIKPYARNSSYSMTIDQKKTEIYKEINNANITIFNMNLVKNGPIEYLTEYVEPFTTRIQKPKHKVRNYHHNRASLNVLRQKLKNHGEMSVYQSKINTLRKI